MQAEGRDVSAQRADKAREHIESLLSRGVRMVALSQVDNAGVPRVKTVPVSLLERCQADLDSEFDRPVHNGPAYGLPVLATISDYVRDLVAALEETGVAVEQFHPEYAMGQLELSVAPNDPVGAADTTVVVRQTIRAMAARHGMRASFSPVVIAGHVGNGGHVHFSLWRG